MTRPVDIEWQAWFGNAAPTDPEGEFESEDDLLDTLQHICSRDPSPLDDGDTLEGLAHRLWQYSLAYGGEIWR